MAHRRPVRAAVHVDQVRTAGGAADDLCNRHT
jgi:hypothetical protein